MKTNNLVDQIFKLDKTGEEKEVFSQETYNDLKEMNIHLQRHLQNLNFTVMTKIQSACFSPVFNGKDTFIKSQTGSGKTLAYLVPLLNYLVGKEPRIQRSNGCYCLVITPTRELSLQIYKLLERLTKGCIYIVPGMLIGGEETKNEKSRIRKGLNIIVGTPGRILYHLQNTQSFLMDKVESIVFEEADKILDYGFEKDVHQILNLINQQSVNYQNIMVSATITDKLESLLLKIAQFKQYDQPSEDPNEPEKPELNLDLDKKVAKVLENFVLVGFEEHISNKIKTPIHLHHFYTVVDQRKKVSLFLTLLKLLENKKTIIFVSTADQVNYLSHVCQHFEI